jgi:hypothetical protein
MTFKYWLKIVLGMAVVFAIGAAVVGAFHRGQAFVKSDRAFTIPMLGAPFRLAGMHIGQVQRMRIERSSARTISGVALRVKLDDSAAIARFDNCALAIGDVTTIDKNTTFACATAEDSLRLQLVPFGTVTLSPGDREVTLMVPQAVVVDLQRGLAGGSGPGDTGNVDVNGEPGSFHVRINGKDVVSILGDSAGGSLKVFDNKGRAIVDIAGDSAGGHVIVKDSSGKTKVNIKGSGNLNHP